MAHSSAAQQRLRAFIFQDLHSPCPDAAGSDVLATCMGDASVVGRIHQLGSVVAKQALARTQGPVSPPLPPACTDLLRVLGGAGKTPAKRGPTSSVSAVTSAYFSATQECRQQIYNLPSLPVPDQSTGRREKAPYGHRRRASQPRVASLAGAHGFDSRHTLQTAIGLSAATWDSFLHLLEQSGDVVGVVQSFVAAFEQLPFSLLQSEEHDEILSVDISPGMRTALTQLQSHAAFNSSGAAPPEDAPAEGKEPPSARVHSLLARLRKWLRDHPAWKTITSEQQGAPTHGHPHSNLGAGLSSGGALGGDVQLSWREVDDCLERFVTGKLHRIITNPLAYPDGHTLNSFLQLRCLALQGLVGWEQLDCKPPPISQALPWKLAIAWLQAVPRFAAPCDKLNCMLNSCSVVSKLLSHSYDSISGSICQADGAQVGADDFLPSLIYTILQAAVPSMYSDLQYVQAYRDKSQLLSENGYYFTNITSACNFVASATPNQLRLHAGDVEAATAQALARMQAQSAHSASGAAAEQPSAGTPAALWEEELLLLACRASAEQPDGQVGTLQELCSEQDACCAALSNSQVDSSVLATLGMAPPAAFPRLGAISSAANPPPDKLTGAHSHHDSELILAALMDGDSVDEDSEDSTFSVQVSAASSGACDDSVRQAVQSSAYALRGVPPKKLLGRSARRLQKLRDSVGNQAPDGQFQAQLARLRSVLADTQIMAAL